MIRPMKGQKQQRRKVGCDGLRDKAKIAGNHRFLILVFHREKILPIKLLGIVVVSLKEQIR